LFGPIKKRKDPLTILLSIIIILVCTFLAGTAALVMAAVLAVLVLFYPFFLYWWDKLYGTRDIADQLFYAHTDDGWNIAMHFHMPRYPKPNAFPVILSHGIAVNKFGVDLDESHSLAYFLKQNGYPVFVLSLRGVGKSYHSSKTRYRDFNFDDIVMYDVPAVIRRVRELTGAPKVNWVGHSMGSMIMYGFLGRQLDGHEDIASFTVLAGPGKLEHAKTTIWGAMAHMPWLPRVLDMKFGAQIISPLTGRFLTPIDNMVYDSENISRVTIRRLMKNGIENIGVGLIHQFLDWIKSGVEHTRDGSFNYRDGFKNIKVPVMFLAGSRDHIAPAESVKFAYDLCGSKVKEYHVLGKQTGFKCDYCHTGIVLGDHARDEVYPMVRDFLDVYGGVKRRRNFVKAFFARLKRKRRQKASRGLRTFRESAKTGSIIVS
jgi:pimeloyl-ACP methyl ester carboxylesterase